MTVYQQMAETRRVRVAKRQQKRKVKADNFIPMDELELRLGCTRRSVYRYAKTPGFLPLVKCGGKVGCLESALEAYLENLPKAELA